MASSLTNGSIIVNGTQEITGVSNTLNDSANEIVTSGGLMDFLYEHGILKNTATVTIIAKNQYGTTLYVDVSGGGEYTIGSTATVTAQVIFFENSFHAWVDSQGNILSTSTTYSFTVTGDVTLTALYQSGSGGGVN